jgi:hypothetical protein
MKKQFALAAAVVAFGTVSVAAPKADALLLRGLFNKIAKRAKNVAGSVINKGAEMAKNLGHKAIDLVRRAAENTLQRLQNAASELRQKGEDKLAGVLAGWGDKIKSKLPHFLRPLVDKGVTLGQGGIRSLGGLVQKGINFGADWARGQVANLSDAARTKLNSLIGSLAERLNGKVRSVISLARRVATGAAQRVQGQVTKMFTGIGKSFASKFARVMGRR